MLIVPIDLFDSFRQDHAQGHSLRMFLEGSVYSFDLGQKTQHECHGQRAE